MNSEQPKRVWTSIVVVIPIRIYQSTLSPLLGRNCRFSPSCSQYALESFQRFGLVKGAILAGRRLSRCHPLGSSGYDPVPNQWGL